MARDRGSSASRADRRRSGPRGAHRAGLGPVLRSRREAARRQPAGSAAQARGRRANRQRCRTADARSSRSTITRIISAHCLASGRPTVRSRTPRASVSASSGSPLALYRRHGFDRARWTAATREALWGSDASALARSRLRCTRRIHFTRATAPGPNRTAMSTSGSNCCTPRRRTAGGAALHVRRSMSKAISGRSSSFRSPTSTPSTASRSSN